MSDAPLVSVVINNYNYERFLGEAIESALAQTYPRTEVVVVDDGSTDGSRALVASYGGRVRAVLKENGGQASAFNAGFRASRGEIVVFLDADDYLFPEAVGRVVAAWGPDVAAVQYRLQMVDASGSPTGRFKPSRNIPMDSGEVWRVVLERVHYTFPPTSGQSFSRSALERILPMPEDEFRIGADVYPATLIPFYGKIVAIEEPLAAYRIHGSNQWTNEDAIDHNKFRASVERHLKKQELIARWAGELGHEVPGDLHVRSHGDLLHRMALSRLDPSKNPYTADRPGRLVYWGLRAVWRFSGLPLRRRLIVSAWFLWVGLLPLAAARPAITWLFADNSRPKMLDLAVKNRGL